ncbi:MAG: galactokinase [Erysipelotrichaceae bacterium]|nr:galactokinase [Erysipelotrichaceae bacterium]
MKASIIQQEIKNRQHDQLLADLYQDVSLVDYHVDRYVKAIDRFIELYGDDDVDIYSVAGRSEIGGNHTDHQHGRVLAASINLDAIAIAAKQDDVIKVVSDSFDIDPISIDDLEMRESEKGTSEALIRGVAYKLKEEGHQVGGFKAFITSDVLIGAGLSSSAAFEDMIGVILSGLYNDMAIDLVDIAKVGQYAENVYFGKPCGLMDQCACGVGGLVAIDFNDPSNPIVKAVDVNFSQFNTSICIVDTKGSHADLTHEYAAVPAEMKKVAQFMGEDFLRDVDEVAFYKRIPEIREVTGDRGVLRAIHFFNENKRPLALVDALEHNDFEGFKKVIQASGNSSYKFLQNVFAASDPQNQSVSLALALSEMILGDHGVCRVHGGGFAGTIQAFVDDDFVETYKKCIEQTFGEGSCHVLKIRPKGGLKVI